MGRITTNADDFRKELVRCLELAPGHHAPVLVFTEVHSLLLSVRAIFVVPDGSKMRLIKRIWFPPKQRDNIVLYDLDHIIMRDHTRVLDRMQAEMIFEYMSFPMKKPAKLEGVLLDGSEYKLRLTNGKHFTWNKSEQLTGSLKKLVDWVEEL
ncbi:MAG TPA: hypothetical protein VK177_05485 [Flavobacteriales bacterium]|nr:hypothetical protein [Flavobacteriales bacterium]